MLPLIGPGSDFSSTSTNSNYAADNNSSRENPPGVPEFHLEGIEVLEEPNRPETDVSVYSNHSDKSSTYLPALPESEDDPSGTGNKLHVEGHFWGELQGILKLVRLFWHQETKNHGSTRLTRPLINFKKSLILP